jgi:hypothetical protein
MTKLPATISDHAVDTVSGWVKIVRDKMTAEASREWLLATLRQYLRQGLIETLQVVEAADAGDEIADTALRLVYAEMIDVGIKPSRTLEAYGIKAVLRGPVQRRGGRPWFDNWRRDIGACVLMFLTMQQFGLRPTRNRAQRRRNDPSAASVVSDAFGRNRVNVSEKTLENIWGAGLGQAILAYAIQHFGLA